MRITVFLFLVLFCCGACKKVYDHKGKTPLVEVDGNFLYKEDVRRVLPMGLSKDDSVLFVEHYVRSWAEDILLYEKAKANIPDSVDVDKLVENYRRALIMHLYHYEKNKEVFKVERPLIKGLFIKVPLTAPKLNSVRRWYKSQKQEAVDNLEKYSLQNAVKYEYFYDRWVAASDVMNMIPLKVENVGKYIGAHRQIELKDTTFCYFLNVSDFLDVGAEEPYEIARQKVKDLLVNQKRVRFMEGVKNDLYQRAVKRDGIVYYN